MSPQLEQDTNEYHCIIRPVVDEIRAKYPGLQLNFGGGYVLHNNCIRRREMEEALDKAFEDGHKQGSKATKQFLVLLKPNK